MDSQESERKEKLYHMHVFYAQSQRHQLSMMWETVKWFTPILTLIAGGWTKLFIDNFLPCYKSGVGFLLIALSLFGITLSFFSMKLLKSFYRTNLKYVTSLGKIEEELDFDARKESRNYYSDDKYITWKGYINHRTGLKRYRNNRDKKESWSSEMLINDQLSVKWYHFKNYSIFNWMRWVFLLFIIAFSIAAIIVIILLLR
jgi:hypothetical protein